MLARLTLVSLLLSGLAAASSGRRVYVVRWADEPGSSPERRELVQQAERRFSDELRRCGASVLEGEPPSTAIVLRPRLEVLPGGLLLRVVGVRGGDQKLLGTISTRASGASRSAQLRAVLSRVCDEAGRLE